MSIGYSSSVVYRSACAVLLTTYSVCKVQCVCRNAEHCIVECIYTFSKSKNRSKWKLLRITQLYFELLVLVYGAREATVFNIYKFLKSSVQMTEFESMSTDLMPRVLTCPHGYVEIFAFRDGWKEPECITLSQIISRALQ